MTDKRSVVVPQIAQPLPAQANVQMVPMQQAQVVGQVVGQPMQQMVVVQPGQQQVQLGVAQPPLQQPGGAAALTGDENKNRLVSGMALAWIFTLISFLIPITTATMSMAIMMFQVKVTASVHFTKTCINMDMMGQSLESCEDGNPGGKGAGAMYAAMLAEAVLGISFIANCCKFRGKACNIAANAISALLLLIATILVAMHTDEQKTDLQQAMSAMSSSGGTSSTSSTSSADDDIFGASATATPFQVENGPALYTLILGTIFAIATAAYAQRNC